MALKNEQYNALMRIYSEKRLRILREQETRKKELFERIPALSELSDALAKNATNRARASISGDSALLLSLQEECELLKGKRALLLKENNIPADYPEPRYDCPDCKDTGYIGNKKCHCFMQAAINLLYDQSNIRDILEKENFDTLSMEYYSRESVNGKKSQYDYMQEKISLCRDYVDYFDRGPDNLLFCGPTGTGKTFLSNCIAKALIDTCHSVVYFSAPELFDMFSRTVMSYDEDMLEQADQFVLESDLLIIDDLGTERVNSFTSSKLFYTVNERLNRGKSTIISTNLSPAALRDTYTERVASRLLSGYEVIQLSGDDLRLRKKYGM